MFTLDMHFKNHSTSHMCLYPMILWLPCGSLGFASTVTVTVYPSCGSLTSQIQQHGHCIYPAAGQLWCPTPASLAAAAAGSDAD
jgi:hypothetical protein